MRKIHALARWGLLAGILGACVLECNEGTELPNEVTGMLYLPGGAPAGNASVALYPVDYIPGTTSSIPETTLTNKEGRYAFTNVAPGQYSVLAHTNTTALAKTSIANKVSDSQTVQNPADNLFSYTDSISVSSGSVNLPPDTLRPSGSLTGSIQMQPGDDPRTVVLYVLGTNNFSVPDSEGQFTLKNMAGGVYWVRFLSTLDSYSPLDLSLTIISGSQDTLPEPVVLPFKGIPTVEGITLKYDTLLQIATLSWKQADTSLISGYNVYRKEGDSNYVRLNSVLITDTSYSDSFMIQDSSYEFNVKSVDKNGNEGTFLSGVGLQAVGAYELIKSFAAGNPLGMFYNGSDQIVTYAYNSGFQITVLDTSLTLLRTFSLDSVAAVEGVDASNRIWTEEINPNLPSAQPIKVFSTNGNPLGTIDNDSSQFQLLSAQYVIGAKSTRTFVAYRLNPSAAYQINVYNNSLQYIGQFPNNSVPLFFTGLNTRIFDAAANGDLTLFTGSDVSIYDTLGTLTFQRQLPYADVEAFGLASNNGYLIYHCEQGCYYDITDNQFTRKAIFLGRTQPPSTFNAFSDGFGRLFVLENSGMIQVYAARRPLF